MAAYKMPTDTSYGALSLASTLIGLVISSMALAQAPARAETDFLTFARGALPVAQAGDAEALKVTESMALRIIDGNPGGFVMTLKPGSQDSSIILTYALPAPTRFSRFRIPNVRETPSPSQTFFARVLVEGSDESPVTGFSTLAGADLEVHANPGEFTELPVGDAQEIRWVRITLSGGLDVQRDMTWFEFSEVEGYGSQQPVSTSNRFQGLWKGRGVLLDLRQDGRLVSGCYDGNGDLNGAVEGNMLYASGTSRDDGTLSSFVLTVDDEGRIQGVRSTNGAPFKPYLGEVAPTGTDAGCGPKVPPALGCGSVVYGIGFDFDSARLKPESESVLDALFAGLEEASETRIVIEGHTSSEGSEAYNQVLSERRARAVVNALSQRGLEPATLTAQGLGESQPIASNDDEAGRSLNRRVAVRCAGL